jgi:hypothetical protein
MLLLRSPFTYIYTVISSYRGAGFFLERGRKEKRKRQREFKERAKKEEGEKS